MGRKSKHSKEIKISIVKRYLSGEASTYYLEKEELAEYIKKYDIMFDHRLGYRMMYDRINRDENKHYNDKQVYKIMDILGIKSIIRRKNHSYTVRKKKNRSIKKSLQCIST